MFKRGKQVAVNATSKANEDKHKREKQFYLFLVAFGGHKSTMSKLKEYFRYESRTGISQFFYLEYFMHEPLKIDKNFVNEGSSVFCPFLERMIKEQPFLLDWRTLEEALNKDGQELKKGLSGKNKEIEKFKRIETVLLPRTRELEKQFLNDPLEIKTNTGWLNIGKGIFEAWKSNEGQVKNLITPDHAYTEAELKSDLGKIIPATDIDEANRKALIKERVVLIYLWAKSGALNSQHIDIVGVPIASNKLFYGYILVGFFHKGADEANGEKRKRLCKDLRSKMGDQAVNFYLPALILCHHSLYEELYLSEKGFSIGNDMPFRYSELSRSKNPLEKNIHKLWEIRNDNADQLSDKDSRKSQFIFKDRFWGSPISIQKIEEALTWDMNFANDKDQDSPPDSPKLKTFLISGGPGSGKETLSKMIGLFSSGHTLSEPYIVNMAALKPDWIAPPSLAGMALQFHNVGHLSGIKLGLNNKECLLDGIFKKVLDKTGKTSDENKGPVIIFDELNSLDTDAQGTLLRIIENAEIVPIGGINKAVTAENAEKLLVIGVVNELPHRLTLEDTIKSFSQNKNLWGSLLGTVLYESFRGVRRLRDDLYYRFRRGGYIALPDLDERREDIPIIFFSSLPPDLRKDIVRKNYEEKIFIEYDVWDLLTDVTIQWKGNIRQLQEVAYNVARAVKKEKTSQGMKCDIDVPMVREVLEKMNLLQRQEFNDDPTTYS